MHHLVLGSGTEVGKTVASIQILRHLINEQKLPWYWKIIQTYEGMKNGPENELAWLTNGDVARVHECFETIQYRRPVFSLPIAISPHLALLKMGLADQYTIEDFSRQIHNHFAADLPTVAETAGGVLVENITGFSNRDLAVMAAEVAQKKLAVWLVGHGGLGSINATLLALEALHAFGVKVNCVVLNRLDPDCPLEFVKENLHQISLRFCEPETNFGYIENLMAVAADSNKMHWLQGSHFPSD